jgi:hypothetical protein
MVSTLIVMNCGGGRRVTGLFLRNRNTGLIQGIANLTRQVAGGVGLLQHWQAFLLRLLKRGNVSAVAGCENHGNIGVCFADARINLRAAELGQNYIQKKKIDLVAPGFEFMQPLFAVRGENHFVAEVGESFESEFAQAGMIFDNENGLDATANRLGVLDWFDRFGRERCGGKVCAKCSSDTQFAVHMREPAVLPDDAVNRGEAETGALAQLLGGEERLENAVDGGRVHTRSRVGDRKHHVVAGAGERLVGTVFRVEDDKRGLDEQGAAVGHGVAGVDAEVHQNLFDLGGIGANQGESGSEDGLDFDIAADYFFEEIESLGDALVQVYIARLENLAARKGQQLTGKCSGSFRLLMDLLKMAAEASAFFGLFHADVGPAHDGADHVVEVVSDSAGELADGFELLRLQELLFEG